MLIRKSVTLPIGMRDIQLSQEAARAITDLVTSSAKGATGKEMASAPASVLLGDAEQHRPHFQKQHAEGKLVHQVPFMKAALFGMRKQNEKRKLAKAVFDLALEIVGVKDADVQLEDSIPFQQAIVYAIVGGGAVGKVAAHKPADFIFDNNKQTMSALNSSKADAYREVIKLTKMGKAQDLNTSKMPTMPVFHHMGVL